MNYWKSFSVVCLVFFTWGCAVHGPSLPHAPILSKKHEFQATANSQNITCLNATLAYALTDHLGVMLKGAYNENGKKSHDNFYHYKNIETGLGYCTAIDKAGSNFLEFYGGYGRGEVAYKSSPAIILIPSQTDDVRFLKADSETIFGQLAFGYKFEEKSLSITAGGGLRGNHIRFRDVLYNYNYKIAPGDKTSGFLLEPFVFQRIGFSKFQVQSTLSYGTGLSKQNPETNFVFPHWNVAVGFVFALKPKI